MGNRMKRARAAAIATQGQHVQAGQVWIDNDSRYKRGGCEPRRLRVESIDGAYAICAYATVTSARRFRIRLDRFRPNATGYRLDAR